MTVLMIQLVTDVAGIMATKALVEVMTTAISQQVHNAVLATGDVQTRVTGPQI